MTSVIRVESVLFEAAATLREVADAGTCGQWLLALLFIRYVTDSLPSQPHGKPGRFVVPNEANLAYLVLKCDEPGNAARLDAALKALSAANGEVGDLFGGVKFSSGARDESALDQALKQALLKFNSPLLDLSPAGLRSGVGGIALEQLAVNFMFASRAEAGELYTPRAVANLMVSLAAPKPGESIHDPACGSAGFLITAADYMGKQHGSREFQLSGQELSRSAYTLSTMNLLLHGFDRSRVRYGDSLRKPQFVQDGRLEQFHVVLANPPFSLENWGWEEARRDPFHRFDKYGLPPRSRGDFAFILHMIASMKPDTGRVAVIVSNGVLFRGGDEALIRCGLIEDNLLDAVIGLPPKLFYNTGIATAILVFRAKRLADDVLFIDASNDFARVRKMNELRAEDVERITATYREGRQIPGYSRLVSRKEIADNEYSISISRYVSVEEQLESVDFGRLIERQRELEQELVSVRRAIDGLWERLSFDK